jgi:Flp pilus assembly protein TadG
MAMTSLILHRFRRSQDGAALVEFAISLPLILVVSFGTIDSMRLFWSYQAAVAGVRDAARYVARVAPDDICTSGAVLADELAARGVVPAAIIDSTIDGGALYTGGVTIDNVTATLLPCGTWTALGLRQAQVPVVRITADMSITLPFTEVFTLVGGAGFGTLTTTIVEDARVFGL